MGNLLSPSHKNSRAKITDADRAVLSLKAQRRKLEDQSKLIGKRIDHNVQVARELISQQKRDRALLALKKKKLNEHQLETIQAWLLRVEDMLSNMELSKQQQQLFTALKEGNEALKAAQKETSLEDVEKLMEDTAEARDYQAKIQDMLGGQLSDIDNEAVLDELVDLELDVLGTEEQQAAAEVAEMPAVPTTKVELPSRPEATAQASTASREQHEREQEQQIHERQEQQQQQEEEEEEEEEATSREAALEQPMAAV